MRAAIDGDNTIDAFGPIISFNPKQSYEIGFAVFTL